MALALVGLQAGPEDRREQLDEHVIGNRHQAASPRRHPAAQERHQRRWKHESPSMMQRSAERLPPAPSEEFLGDGLEIGEVERLFQKLGVAAQRLDPGGESLVTKGCHHNDRRADTGGSRRMRSRAAPSSMASRYR